ncbi:hypothetical protein Sgleb_70250 [Streptomyces glebosus]|uniref:Uncharacterized protein n=1 Tax=Streptomyces glebosus TaxID=249580 RepID=A0A640T6R2_9ACTN|nr:hypothetical protein Sgleb_70250 [Streptomyces glebosus]GHG48659.1 hypothetical protein GCM10010513_05770 [Streptomyces glebosus]
MKGDRWAWGRRGTQDCTGALAIRPKRDAQRTAATGRCGSYGGHDRGEKDHDCGIEWRRATGIRYA